MRQKIQKEIDLGRIAGPYKNKPISNLRTSPIGLVEKTDGSWRLITHLSHPPGNSVNDYIDPQACSVHYSSFDKVIDMISTLGPSALLARMDVKSAFRLINIFPGDFDLLGFMFEGKYYTSFSV